MELLSVPARTLREHGAVSAPVVTAMAERLLKMSGVHLSLAVTGIAGPTGGTKENPVGSVYIGLASAGPPGYSTRVRQAGESHSRLYHFTGGRETIKFQASQMALDTVRRWLLGIKS
jgi:PncC family amidohydrolase